MRTRLPAFLLPLFLLPLATPDKVAAAPGAPAALTAVSLPGTQKPAPRAGEATRKEPAAPGKPHPFTFEDMVHLQRIGDLHLSSPSSGDGKVAYVVTTADPDKNTFSSSLQITAATGGPPRQLTFPPAFARAPVKDGGPRFSPDGNRLAFLSNRDGANQVYVLDLRGGEARRVTNLPGGAGNPVWFPDGASLLVESSVFPECPTLDAPGGDECNRRRAETVDNGPIKARVVERLFYRHWDTWFDGRRSHLVRVPVSQPEGGGAAGASKARGPVDLTPGDFDAPPIARGGEQPYAISPDGKELVFVSNRDKDQATSTNTDLFLQSLVDPRRPAKNITEENHSSDTAPRYSPDGHYLAYLAQKRPGFEADRQVLWLYDRQTGKRRALTEPFDANAGEPVWSADGKRIYFSTYIEARGRIFSIGLDGGAPVEVAAAQAEDMQLQVTPGPNPRDVALIYRGSTFGRAQELYRLPLDGGGRAAGPAVALTGVNDAAFASLQLGKVVDQWGKTADGQRLHSFLFTPPNFDPGRRYPAVVLIHGGPQGAWEDQWHYRWNPQIYAGAGYVVMMVNPRGSDGFGQRFVDQVSGDWGGKAYDDIMRAVDQLVALPYVDGKRVGALGASYGGYMVDWIAGHTDRFAALISHDGVYDLRSMQGETEEQWFTRWEFQGDPWSSDQYDKWSPSRFAGNMKTPMLVVTNEKDYRVPVGQGMQLFTALQLRKVPSKMLIFPDENHWVLKPGNSRLWHAEVLDWLHTYLKGGQADSKALRTAASYAR